MEFFQRIYFCMVVLLFEYFPISKSYCSILNSNLSTKIFSYEPYQGNCNANTSLITKDKGYLVAGETSFLLGTGQKYLIIIKFNCLNNVQFKVKIPENSDSIEIHQLQETETFYYLITKEKIIQILNLLLIYLE